MQILQASIDEVISFVSKFSHAEVQASLELDAGFNRKIRRGNLQNIRLQNGGVRKFGSKDRVIKNRLPLEDYERYRREGRCFKCHKLGHTAARCGNRKDASKKDKKVSVTAKLQSSKRLQNLVLEGLDEVVVGNPVDSSAEVPITRQADLDNKQKSQINIRDSPVNENLPENVQVPLKFAEATLLPGKPIDEVRIVEPSVAKNEQDVPVDTFECAEVSAVPIDYNLDAQNGERMPKIFMAGVGTKKGSTEKGKQGLTMSFVGHIAGQEVNVLVDSGASRTFLSADACQKTGLPVVPLSDPSRIIQPNGASTPIQGTAAVLLVIEGAHLLIHCLVADLKSFDVILGDDYLRAKDAILDFKECTVTLTLNGSPRVWRGKMPKQKTVAQLETLNTSQFRRAMRNGAQLFIGT